MWNWLLYHKKYNDLGFDQVFDLFSAYKLGKIQKLPKMKKRVIFFFFLWENWDWNRIMIAPTDYKYIE